MNIFISQPMNGKSTDQIKNERKKVELFLNGLGHNIIDSINKDYELDNIKNKGVYYLSESIKKLSKSDCVFFMKGWNFSRGCRIEHEICVRYGIKTYYEENFKELE